MPRCYADHDGDDATNTVPVNATTEPADTYRKCNCSNLLGGDADMLGWYDNADDSFTTWEASNLAVGEQSFVPLPGDPDPTRGWWTTIATDRTDHTSRLLIIPAADPASGPVATVALPQRVPLGLHGSWQPTGEWRPPRRPDPDRSNRSPTLDRISDCTELAGSPAA